MRYKIGMTIGVLLILVWCLLPVAWIISLSFKSQESITVGNPGFLPSEGTGRRVGATTTRSSPTTATTSSCGRSSTRSGSA